MGKSTKKINSGTWNWQPNPVSGNRKIKEQNKKAIEQLEIAKDYIYEKLEYMWNNNAELSCRDRTIIDKIYEQIDQQINELKGKVEDVKD